MTDLFLSYSRQEREFVEKLRDTLSLQHMTVWVDLKDIPPTAEFMQEIYSGIEAANNFVFIISPHSAISDTCNLEVSYAVRNNKRIIPVLYQEVNIKKLPQSPVRSLLDRINWFRPLTNNDYADLCQEIIKITKTDLYHVRAHTRLLIRAKEWEAQVYDHSYLLQGIDLDTAESWLETSLDKQPQPTELHHQYISISKKHQLEENNKWEELYRVADENQHKAEKALAEFYKEQGRSELLNGSSMKAALYLSEAYKMGLADNAIRFLLAEAMKTVDAQIQTFNGHENLVMTAEFSLDGLHVVTASWDKTARVWDVSTGEAVAILRGHSASLNMAVYSSDKHYIATAGQDKIVNIWDVQGYKLYATLEEHNSPVMSAQFSPDNSLIVTACDGYRSEDESQKSVDTSVRVWSVHRRERLFTLEHTDPVTSAIFSPDGSKIATGSTDGSIKIWDSKIGTCIFTFTSTQEEMVFKGANISLAFSPDGTLIAAGGGEKITVWDTRSGEILLSGPVHLSIITSILFSPDGTLIATSSLDKSALIVEVKSGKKVSQLEGHKASVTSVIFSPDGLSILTTSMDGTAKLWEVNGGRLIQSIEGHREEIVHAQFNTDGTRIVTASWDRTAKLWSTSNNRFRPFFCNNNLMLSAAFNENGSRVITTGSKGSHDPDVRVWDFFTGKSIFSLQGHVDTVEFANFSPKRDYIVTTSADKTAKIWDARDGELLSTLIGHTDTVKYAAFNSDGTFVATASYDKTAKLWDVFNSELRYTLEGHSSDLLAVKFSPDDKLLITASNDGKAILWDAVNGKLLFYLEHAGSLHTARFNPNGKYVLTASEDKTAKVWDSLNGQLLRTFGAHTSNVFALDITNDSQKVVTASADKSAKIWDFLSGRLLYSLDDHEGMVWDAQFSSDGKFIITIDIEDQAAKIWDTATGVLLSRLENPTVMTTSAQFSPDNRSVVTTQAGVVFNPNVKMSKKTFSTPGNTLIAWTLLLEMRDPYQISLLVKERVPFCIEEGRLLPTTNY